MGFAVSFEAGMGRSRSWREGDGGDEREGGP
jgi:hypothetical protein